MKENFQSLIKPETGRVEGGGGGGCKNSPGRVGTGHNPTAAQWDCVNLENKCTHCQLYSQIHALGTVVYEPHTDHALTK